MVRSPPLINTDTQKVASVYKLPADGKKPADLADPLVRGVALNDSIQI